MLLPATGAPKPKILIVEPDRAFITTLASALNAKGYGIVGTATETASAIEYFNRIKPDVLITEVDLAHSLNSFMGIDLASHFRAKHPMLGVVFLTSLTNKSLVGSNARLLETSYFLSKKNITKMDVIEVAIMESLRLVRAPENPTHDIYGFNSEKNSSIKLAKSDLALLDLISDGM